MCVLQDEVDCEMECDTLLPQAVPNGNLPVYHYSTRYVYRVILHTPSSVMDGRQIGK